MKCCLCKIIVGKFENRTNPQDPSVEAPGWTDPPRAVSSQRRGPRACRSSGRGPCVEASQRCRPRTVGSCRATTSFQTGRQRDDGRNEGLAASSLCVGRRSLRRRPWLSISTIGPVLPPGESVWVYAAVSNPCCPPSCHLCRWRPWLARLTPSALWARTAYLHPS